MFVVETDELVKNKKEDLFTFRNQMSFLDNLEMFITSTNSVKCSVAFTNLKSLIFYKPTFKMMNILKEMKNFSNILKKEKFRKFWNDVQNQQYEIKEREDEIEKKRKNVKK